MAGAARVHIAERGRDPRHYALLCTGGAGPVHALLRRAEARPHAGDLPAVAGRRLGARPAGGPGPRRPRGDGRPAPRPRPAAPRSRRRSAGSRTKRARSMADTGLKLDAATVRRLADGRFLGQGFDLVVDLARRPLRRPDAIAAARLTAAFETAYREKFALTPAGRPGGVHQHPRGRARARRRAIAGDVALRGRAGAGGSAIKGGAARTSPRPAASSTTTVYDRDRLAAGRRDPRPGGGRRGRLDAGHRPRRHADVG